MKQIFQDLGTGETVLADMNVPRPSAGQVLIRSVHSVISLGTERMLVAFGKANLIDKARQQPEKVRQVLQKVRSDGLRATFNSIKGRLEQPLPLGYSNSGMVVETGAGVTDLVPGDRVVSNGPHAEIVLVPRNLVAAVPESVGLDEAAFTVVGSIALQGLRLAVPEIGQTIVVIGLGLIGQLAAQLVQAAGCRAIAFDIDSRKIELAGKQGVAAFLSDSSDAPIQRVMDLTGGLGADAVLITASSSSDTIISQAANMCRKRAKVILVGSVGLDLNRADFYEKELSFQVSCSYGPGRYDPEYEQKGHDYPHAYVRWTENRNFSAILDLMQAKKLNVKDLVSRTVPFEDAANAYSTLGKDGSIATLFSYGDGSDSERTVRTTTSDTLKNAPSGTCVAVVGAGLYARTTLLPGLANAGLQVSTLCTRGSSPLDKITAKYRIAKTTTDIAEVLADKAVAAVVIATRHNLHAEMVIAAIRAGKHVFVEKPLCISNAELDAIIEACGSQAKGGDGPTVTVGFNRRFSPLVTKAQSLLGETPPLLNAVLTFNAGSLPASHWTRDIEIGGGRIVGEACHFLDLFVALTNSTVVAVCANNLGQRPDSSSDNVSILLKSANGSQGIVNYFANGSKRYPKEKIEVFSANRVLVIDGFRTLTGYGYPKFNRLRLKRVDKGHAAQFLSFRQFLEAGGRPPVPFSEIVNVTRATMAVIESIRTHGWVEVR